jgi:glucose-1-phosphate thymidylyltransferase
VKGIVLHGGYGTKLRPLTHTGPKQLIPVANKPISQYALEDLRNSGVRDVAIVLGNIYPEKVKAYYGNGQAFGLKIHYIQQDEPKGIAQAVQLCQSYTRNQPFIVYLGDNMIKGGISDVAKKFENSDDDAYLLLCKVKEPQRFGVARLDAKGKLVQLIEKPQKPPSNYALTGIYFFRPTIFEMIKALKPSGRGELEITEAIQLLLEKGYKLDYQVVQGWWKDTGTPQDILEANRLVLDEMTPQIKGLVVTDNSVQGRVTIGQKSKVEEGALVRGPVIIGENTVIKGKVFIGPYTSIGNNCTLERGEIENSIIMDNCTINVNERITDSLIASGSTITLKSNERPAGNRFIVGERTYIQM